MEELIETFGSIQLFLIFLFLSIWSLVWKIVGAWKASKDDAKLWYIAMMIFNTFGIVEIIYIFFISNKKKAKKEK